VAWDASTDGAFGARRVADKDTQLKVSKRAASVKPWDPQPGKLPLTPAPNLVRSSANSPRDHLARDRCLWFRTAMLPRDLYVFRYTFSSRIWTQRLRVSASLDPQQKRWLQFRSEFEPYGLLGVYRATLEPQKALRGAFQGRSWSHWVVLGAIFILSPSILVLPDIGREM